MVESGLIDLTRLLPIVYSFGPCWKNKPKLLRQPLVVELAQTVQAISFVIKHLACRIVRALHHNSDTITQMHRHLRGAMKFDDVKSDTLNLRVSPSFKLALKAAADHEQRSMVNMLEVLVAVFCESKNIAVPAERAAQTRAVKKPNVKAEA
ncbi:hypothetical protein [Alcaligenes faecalis]|nr:hypothetical protein [Alcaligenes faecalis]